MIEIRGNQIDVIDTPCEEHEFFSVCESYAVALFNKSDDMPPFSMFWIPDNRVMIASWNFSDKSEKDYAMFQARMLCKQLHVTKYFFASEVWMKEMRKDAPNFIEETARVMNHGVSNEQDRKEKLFLLMETRGAEDKTVQYDIVRFEGGGKPQLFNRKEVNGGIGTGRSAGMLN